MCAYLKQFCFPCESSVSTSITSFKSIVLIATFCYNYIEKTNVTEPKLHVLLTTSTCSSQECIPYSRNWQSFQFGEFGIDFQTTNLPIELYACVPMAESIQIVKFKLRQCQWIAKRHPLWRTNRKLACKTISMCVERGLAKGMLNVG